MAVNTGFKRLNEFDYLTELSDEARTVLDIPENAEIVNITDQFRNGGPIVISYSIKTTDEERQDNRRRLQYAIDNALDKLSYKMA